MSAQWVRAAFLAGVACVAAACGGGGDSSGGVVPSGLAASFTGSGTAQANDLVRLTGGAASGDLVTVNVVLGGPTTTTGLYAFAFDLVLGNTDVASYVSGSATAGPLLSPEGCAGVRAVAAVQGNRIVLGVTKLGDCPGNGSSAAEEILVSLTFRVGRAGATTLALAGSPADPPYPATQPSAMNPQGDDIASIVFDLVPATIRGD